MTLILGLMLLTYMGNLPQQLSNSSLGRVEGVVVDADNKPIRGAYVYATSQSSPGRPHTVLTDAQGAFVLDDASARLGSSPRGSLCWRAGEVLGDA